MVKDHSDSERGNPLPPLHGLLFLINFNGSFKIHHSIDRTAQTTAFVVCVFSCMCDDAYKRTLAANWKE